MIRFRNSFAAFVLALLVVGLQYGAQLHAIEHLGDALRHAPDQSFSKAPVTESCAICALFAGGANAVASDDRDPTLAPVTDAKPRSASSSIAAAAPSYYSSRAPPPLL